MTKKEYMQPVLEVCQTDAEMQILVGSVTSVISTGLQDDDLVKDDDAEDPWDSSM